MTVHGGKRGLNYKTFSSAVRPNQHCADGFSSFSPDYFPLISLIYTISGRFTLYWSASRGNLVLTSGESSVCFKNSASATAQSECKKPRKGNPKMASFRAELEACFLWKKCLQINGLPLLIRIIYFNFAGITIKIQNLTS